MKDFISYENDLDGYTNKIRSRKDFSLKKRRASFKSSFKTKQVIKKQQYSSGKY